MSIQVQVNKGQAAVVLSAAKWRKVHEMLKHAPQTVLRDEVMDKITAAERFPAV